MIIKKMIPLAVTVMVSLSAFAQKPVSKVVLKKGQVVKMTTETESNMKQFQGDMSVKTVSQAEMKVLEVLEDGYKVEVNMTKMKADIKSAFFTGAYDSEDEAKQEGQVANMMKQYVNKPEVVELRSNGMVVREEGKEVDMMRMMGGGDLKTAVEGAYLVFPADVEVGKKWRTQYERDGLTTITEYTLKGMMGTMANLTANQQVKGTMEGTGRGAKFSTDVNNLTQLTLLVDANSGLVLNKTVSTTSSSSTKMGDETYKSSGTTTSTVTCE